MKKTIYTRYSNPFVMGGDVNGFIATEVECSDVFDIGRGFQAVLVVSPEGQPYVCEATTGAIVGGAPGDVRADVAAGEQQVIEQQIAQGRENAKRAHIVPAIDFWEKMRRAR